MSMIDGDAMGLNERYGVSTEILVLIWSERTLVWIGSAR